jgi:YD repeat-containing protein
MVQAGGNHSLALQPDGTVVAWGANEFGQLGGTSSDTCNDGSGPYPCSRTPIPVTGLTGVTYVAAGDSISLVIKADETVWGWGSNQNGTIGDGTFTQRNSPVQVDGLGGNGHLIGITTIGSSGHTFAVVALPTQATPAGTQYTDISFTGYGGACAQTFTGALSCAYSHTDLAIAGRGPSPLLTRSYSSNDTRVGPLGHGWTHNYNAHLALPGDGSGAVILEAPDGRSDRYTTSGGIYTAPPAVYTTLVRNNDGSYTATHKDQTQWVFDGGGRLTRIADRYGNASLLGYNSQGQLASVGDPAGRGSLTLAYNASGLLASIADWASPTRSVQYGYDGNGRLQTVTDRSGKVATYPENPV